MRKKNTLLIGFALFSLFFGAGNLILPPMLGLKSGVAWWAVLFGFSISAVLIPILGLLAHAKLQGTLFDFAKKVSPTFSLIYAILIYAISITLPSPRTASVTHEMAVAPLFDISPWVTSSLYFLFVLIFVLNRSKILAVIGKLLTPAIIFLLFAIIFTAVFQFEISFGASTFENAFSAGILEGYQTFDAIGAVVVGGVIIISINLKFNESSFQEKKGLIINGGLLAGLALFIIYGGLIFIGALAQNEFENDISRTVLLSGLSLKTLGGTATLFLSLLVGLACFTTAVGIVTGTADFVRSRFNDSNTVYTVTAALGCLLGVLMGQFNVDYIIAVALPALMFIYPLTIVLIFLNVLPEKFASKKVFRWVVATTLLFSIPDFLATLGLGHFLNGFSDWIPLAQYQMGWLLPTLLVFILINSFGRKSFG